MRANEFIKENAGATCSGSIATVAAPIGQPISRQFTQPKTKYVNTYKKQVPKGK